MSLKEDLHKALTRGYVSKGETIEWEKDITPEVSNRMIQGEIFILLGPDDKPYATLLKDSYGTIRQRLISDIEPV